MHGTAEEADDAKTGRCLYSTGEHHRCWCLAFAPSTKTPHPLADAGPVGAARWLLRELAARGITITCLADRLRVMSPQGAFTDEYRELVTSMKAEIIEALRTHPCSDCGRYAFPEPTRCFWCRRFGSDRRTWSGDHNEMPNAMEEA